MLIFAGTKRHNKVEGTVQGVTCPNCHQVTTFNKCRNKITGYIMFIPFISRTLMAFVQCTHCQAAYEVDKKSLKQMDDPEELISQIILKNNQKKAKEKKKIK